MAERPTLRPDPAKDMSSRERAEMEAREFFDRGGLYDNSEEYDEYNIGTAVPPDGYSYEWKRVKLLNVEETAYQTQLAQAGWRPVPAKRHPELMPGNYTGANITRNDQMLMERPTAISDAFRERDRKNARLQVKTKEDQLTQPPSPGQFERTNKDQSLVSVKKSFAPMPIPE